MATRLHFTSEGYDAFKYRFYGPKIKAATMSAHRDRYKYEKWASITKTMPVMGEAVAANILHLQDSNIWIGSMRVEVWNDWIGFWERHTYEVEQAISRFREAHSSTKFDDMFAPSPSSVGGEAMICELLRNKTLSPILCSVINSLVGFTRPSHLKRLVGKDILGDNHQQLLFISKLTPFVRRRINKEVVRRIIIKSFT